MPGQILAARVPARLVWSTRSPRDTYGNSLVDEVERAEPGAVIWDTSQRGKPDLVRLARQAYDDFDAEAVFVVSNQPTTRRLVHAMERMGMPIFGRFDFCRPAALHRLGPCPGRWRSPSRSTSATPISGTIDGAPRRTRGALTAARW